MNIFSNVTLSLSLSQTPSQQAAMLDNDQEGVSGSNQWAPYSLGRRDVPPDNLMKKVGRLVKSVNLFIFVLLCFIHLILHWQST